MRYHFTAINMPGTTRLAPFILCTVPTILKPNMNKAVDEKAEPNTYLRKRIKKTFIANNC